jgi:hypothetical protein
MAFNKNPDVPGSYRGNPICKVKEDGEHYCGKAAFNWIRTTLNINGRETNARFPVCDDHFKVVEVDDKGAYTLGTTPLVSQ